MKTFIFFTAILTISLTRLSETDDISSNYRGTGVHAMPKVGPININETLWLKKKYGINLLRLGCLNTQQEVRAVADQNATILKKYGPNFWSRVVHELDSIEKNGLSYKVPNFSGLEKFLADHKKANS